MSSFFIPKEMNFQILSKNSSSGVKKEIAERVCHSRYSYISVLPLASFLIHKDINIAFSKDFN